MMFNDSRLEHLRYNTTLAISNIFLPGYTSGDSAEIHNLYKTPGLGLCMSTSGDFSDQINSVKTKGKRFAGWVLCTFMIKEVIPMITLYKSLVLSILEYCC